MKVVKINDKIRDELAYLYNNISLYENDCVIEKIYNRLKYKDDFSRYIMGLLLSTSYICLNEESKFRPNSKEYKEKIKEYEKINSIDDFIDEIGVEELLDVFYDNYNFTILDYDTKRFYINNSYVKKKYLMKIFPCHVLDVVHYNIFTVDEIFEQYRIFNEIYDNKKEAFENTVMYTSEKLIELFEENFENYELTILSIIEKYYLYNKYLLLNNVELNEKVTQNINDIENDLYSMINFYGNSSYILEPIIRSYIKFEENESIKRKVSDYFDDDKNKNKILKLYKIINKIKYYNDN